MNDACRFTEGCEMRGTHWCSGQKTSAQPGLPAKYDAVVKELEAERELRHGLERTIARLEGFRASWQSRCADTERQLSEARAALRETEEKLTKKALDLEAAEAAVTNWAERDLSCDDLLED